MWDKRYEGDEYLFGTSPAAFLADREQFLRASAGKTCLAVADGEGRNSVFMAKCGIDVTSMDSSEIGQAKAKKLAKAEDLSINFQVADLRTWGWHENAFDLVVAIFIQFADPVFRTEIFEGMKKTVKPGGTILLHGYTPKQIEYGTGGPGVAANLYTPEILADAFEGFEGFEIEALNAYDKVITEGTGHSGKSALIDLVARKPV
ncbi:MAG: class I SAM-dependent methyltransferase [Paracoccaceae bacterium]|nr:class I SAM-dependent methyltransferase [Paracoccaceae bacterium]MDG2258518.1 class I SAM-dependent methyltransferase [Paracoccaceae bacterium]